MKHDKIIFLPTFVKYIGFSFISISIVICILHLLSGISITDFFNANAGLEVIAVYVIFILGSVLIIFSKEKKYSELDNKLRLESFLATIVLHSLFFLIFSFTNFTLFIVNFPAIILMSSILLIYIMIFYINKLIIHKNHYKKNSE